MTTNPPTGGQPPSPNQGPGDDQPTYGQPAYSQPEYGPPVWGSTDVVGDQAAQRPAGGNRAFVPWIIGLVVLLVIGGGAFAVRAALGGGGDQPAAALPAGAVAYGRIDLDPAGAQKIAALRLADKFPGFAEATGITDPEVDLRERLWELIQADEASVADIDYQTDIEPWLGSRAALVYVPPEGDAAPETGVVVALQVTDQDAAAEGLEKLMAASASAGESGEPAGVAFVADYALIAINQEAADAFAAAAETSSLADAEGFQQDMAALGEEGVASFWMSKDVYALIAEASGEDLAASGVSPSLFSTQGNLAMALRFDESYLEVAVAVTEAELPEPEGDAGSDLMVGLPESTLLAVSTTYGSEYVDQAWSQLQELGAPDGVDLDAQVEGFEQQTGLSLPEDIATLLGDGFAIAVDREGIDGLAGMAGLADMRIGALFDADPAAAGAVIDKLVAAAGGAIELEVVESDGVLAVSPDAAYAAELTGGSLGESEAFQNAVPDAGGADFAMFFSMDALETSSLYADSVTGDIRANLDVISAIGMSGTFEDGVGRASLRVVVGE